MKSIKISFVLIALSLSFIACQKEEFLGPDAINSPESNFEIFWNDFEQHYGLFQARGWDWHGIYDQYRPQVTAQTNQEELWAIFTQMIETLDDSHTTLHNPEKDETYKSGNKKNKEAKEIFDRDVVEKNYLEYLKAIDEKEYFTYGEVRDLNVGYIHLSRFKDIDPKKIDQVIQDLSSTQAIIFDIRSNGGGVDDIATRIAGAFADGEHFVYTSQTRDGPNYNDFDEKLEHFTAKKGEQQYLNPVIILTDRATISAAEEFLLHMKAFANVTQIGDATAGDFSDVSAVQFLPNGWIYVYSTQMYLLPDGTSLDGIGHVPDIYSINTLENVAIGKDAVMERAFEFLGSEYGIQ